MCKYRRSWGIEGSVRLETGSLGSQSESVVRVDDSMLKVDMSELSGEPEKPSAHCSESGATRGRLRTGLWKPLSVGSQLSAWWWPGLLSSTGLRVEKTS